MKYQFQENSTGKTKANEQVNENPTINLGPTMGDTN